MHLSIGEVMFHSATMDEDRRSDILLDSKFNPVVESMDKLSNSFQMPYHSDSSSIQEALVFSIGPFSEEKLLVFGPKSADENQERRFKREEDILHKSVDTINS